MLVLGVDPGLTGALAWVDRESGELIDAVDMPVYELKKKKHIDVYELTKLIKDKANDTEFCSFEKVGAMPKQGLSSTFRFGYVTGVAFGVVGCLDISLINVSPTVWKRFFGLGRDKNDSRALAIKKWPKKAKLFARKKDDGRAEAALLAEFLRVNKK